MLAETGLLDKKKAVTHWRSCERLAGEFPKIDVDPEPLFIRDGNVWTTAGVTAGIDLTLSLIEDDHGAALASRPGPVCPRRHHRPGEPVFPFLNALPGAIIPLQVEHRTLPALARLADTSSESTPGTDR